MSNYFSNFPKIQHDLKNNRQKITLTNIFRRFKVVDSVQEKINVFYDYTIQDGDRPDSIAEKYYNNSKLAWVILHYNNINDVRFDFPLFGEDFDNMIKSKYGNQSTAQATVHEYRKVLNEKRVKFDGTIIEKRYVVVDEQTYSGLSENERESISKYDYELELNEQKRKIKILDKRYIPQVKNEVREILRDE